MKTGLICLISFAASLLGTSCLTSAAAAVDAKFFTQKPVVAASRVRSKNPPPTPKTKSPKNADLSAGPAAQWIWGGPAKEKDRYFFRKEFEGGSKTAMLIGACDNRMRVFINDIQVIHSSTWEAPVTVDIQRHIKKGKNVLMVQAYNAGGVAGLAVKLAMKMPDGTRRYVVTDKSWKAALKKTSDRWSDVVALGKMGVKPWGDVFAKPLVNVASAPRNVFNVLPGFQVELLYTVPKETQGSWVCITFDKKGRLIASDQGGKGLFRVTPPPIGSDQPTKVESLDVKMTSVQGMLDAFGSLYCSVNGGPGSGLYRLKDTNGDDQYDEVKLLKRLQGGGEHGPHALRLSPDGKSLFIVCGNHTNPPKFDTSRAPLNYGEDLLLLRQWDARGHARGRLAPGGWVAKTDPDGKKWELFSNGYRNSYDMAFNADGELFVYDADMEWDMGSPWYRPTRVVHATSGSEFGWRSGTGKWPVYFPDSLPPVVNLGPGSPVGVEFGYGTKFPAKYQKALYVLDWTFGTIFAVHLQPQGSSYTGTTEEFLSRTPLPLTDAAVGPDGALYFTVGGRGTQSELFRVTYTGKAPTKPVSASNKQGEERRSLRKDHEGWHWKLTELPKVKEPMSADDLRKLRLRQTSQELKKIARQLHFHGVWKDLSHEDRFIRYATRIALENSPVKTWQERALQIENPQGLITSVVALARQGDKSLQPRIVKALDGIDFKSLNEALRLELLRAYALTFIRMGRPDAETASRVALQFDKYYPAKSNNLNRELSRLLVYLNSPTVITKTLKLMEQKTTASTQDIAELIARNPGYAGPIAKMLANYPDQQKIFYGLVLRNMRFGWTLDERKRYFAVLADQRTRSGGASFQGFIDNIRKEALANASPAERKALEGQVALRPPKPEELPKPIGPGKKWNLADLAGLTKSGLHGRDFEKGRRAYAATRCVVCHRFGGEGGATGPDLTNVAGRFTFRDLSESLIEPSKVISDQYRSHTIVTGKGKQFVGRVVSEQNGKLTILTDPEDATKVLVIARGDLESLTPSKLSLMPKDLLGPLNKEEVLDLLAYLMSRGNPSDRMFKKQPASP